VLGRVVVPLLLVLGCTAGAMGWYNLRVTGNAFRMPYQVHEATYAVAPVFFWQDVRPEPVYRHKIIRDYQTVWELEQYRWHRSIAGFVRVSVDKIKDLLQFYLGFALTVPLVTLPWVLRSRWMRFALLTCGVLGVGLLGAKWMWPHYAAPMTGLIFVLVVQAMRHLRLWRWRGRPTGQCIVWAIPVVCVATLVLAFAQQLRTDSYGWRFQRQRILTQLQADGERHLVIVRYDARHSSHVEREWVYNEANIDAAKVVWAREMDTTHNRKLVEYFAGRRVWLLEPDAQEPHVVPYPLGSGS
jgi:hypothetical protein